MAKQEEWSALTSTRFLRTRIQKRAGVNALHLAAKPFAGGAGTLSLVKG
jgi:hypothetical protein